MKRKFAYVFPMLMPDGSCRLEWSSETFESLLNRLSGADKDLAADFIEANVVGSFIRLESGDMAFQIS